MSKNNFGAGISFGVTGFDKTMKQYAQIQNSFTSIRGAAQLADKAFQGLVNTFKLAGVAGRFEEGLAAVGLVTRATSKDLVKLRGVALDAALSTQFSPQEAVEGLQLLSTAGLSLTESMKVLKPVLDLAAGSLGQLGLAESAKAVSGALNAFQLDATKATEVTDKLLRITQLTNFQAKDLGPAFGKASASMNKYGQTLDETLILTGLLKNLNLDASSASTAVRNAILRLGGDQKVQNLVMSKGVKLLDKSTGKMRPLLDIMQDLGKATKNMGTLQRQAFSKKVFGARGIFADAAVASAKYTETLKDGSTVTLRGAKAVAALRREMAKSAGTARVFREKMLATFEGQKKLLTGIIETIAVLVGEPLVAVFKPFVEAVVIIGGTLARFLRSIPAPVKKLVALVAVLSIVFTVLAASVIAAKIIFAGFGLLLAAMNISILGILSTMVILSAAFVAVGAVVAGLFFAFKTNFGGIADTLDAFKLILEGVTAVAKNWKDGTSEIPIALASALKDAGLLDMAIKIGGFFGRTIQFVKDLVSLASTAGGAIKEATAPFLSSLLNIGQAVFDLFSVIFKAVFGGDAIAGLKGTRVAGDTVESTFMRILFAVNAVAKAIAVPINFIAKMINLVSSGKVGKGFGAAIEKGLLKVWNTAKQIWGILVRIGTAVLPVIMFTVAGVVDVFTAAWNIVKLVGQGILDALGGSEAMGKVWQGVKDVFTIVKTVVGVIVAVFVVLFRIVAAITKWLVDFLAPVFFAIGVVVGTIVDGWLQVFKVIIMIGAAIRKHIQGPIDFVRNGLSKISFGLVKASVAVEKNVVVSTALEAGSGKAAPILSAAKQAKLPLLPSFAGGGMSPGTAAFAAAKADPRTKELKTSFDNAAGATKDLQRSMDANTAANQVVIKLLSNPMNTQAILAQAITLGLQQATVSRGGRL